jgi:hypothetical protein
MGSGNKVEVRVEIAIVRTVEKFGVDAAVIGIVVALAQGQQADVGMLEGVEDTVATDPQAMELAAHMFELLFDFGVGGGVLDQQVDLVQNLAGFFRGQA